MNMKNIIPKYFQKNVNSARKDKNEKAIQIKN